MSGDSLGDRMKDYERRETERAFLPMLPVYARIDGRCFSAFTRGMRRPYDRRLSDVMVGVTAYLVEETHARIGYTQSDEISLVWLAERYDSEIFFAGKVQKMCSVLASLAAARLGNYWTRHIDPELAHYADRLPAFDCRVFQLPNREEAANAFLWRERDATKNAISMAARSVYSHKALDHKNSSEMQEMLFAKSINFNDYPAFFKRGTFVRRVTVERPFTEAELARIPEKHRPAPDALVTRSETRPLDMPPFNKVTNRADVIFDGAEPIIAEATAEPATP